MTPPHLGGYGNTGGGRLVAGQGRSTYGAVGGFTHERLFPGIPMPQQLGAILRTECDGAI